jgi:hypothetical protein
LSKTKSRALDKITGAKFRYIYLIYKVFESFEILLGGTFGGKTSTWAINWEYKKNLLSE